MSKGPVGAADDAVHLPDVGAVVGPDHDGVQGRRRTVKMHEQATFVAFCFNRACEHLKAQSCGQVLLVLSVSVLLPSLKQQGSTEH